MTCPRYWRVIRGGERRGFGIIATHSGVVLPEPTRGLKSAALLRRAGAAAKHPRAEARGLSSAAVNAAALELSPRIPAWCFGNPVAG